MKIALRFFDIQGGEVKLYGVSKLTGLAILNDGTRKNITFTPEQAEGRGYSTYAAFGQRWINDSDGFSFIMNIPAPVTFELSYSYGCSSSKG